MSSPKTVDHIHKDTREHHKNIKSGAERLDRHSASGVRGEPRKGGAGGKGAWGVAGGEYDVEPVAVLNEKDPNYDPEEQEKETEKEKNQEKEKETPPVQHKE